MESIITLTDSYKLSHFNQYPHNTDIVHSYLIPRSTEYDKIVFFGLHYYIKKYLKTPITQRNIDAVKKALNTKVINDKQDGKNYK